MGDPIELGLSFDDVLLVPQKSEILPSDADLSSRLTSDIPLKIPILSSAMDTVTEDRLAIALARQGGLGVIHRNCPIDKQSEFVARVKRSENMVIQNPFTVSASLTMAELEQVMKEKGVAGFPVVDDQGTLEGMVTSRDIWYVESPNLRVKDVMTPRDRLVTAPLSTTHQEAKAILYKNRIEKLPLVDDEGRLAGMITSQDIEKQDMFTDACKDPNGQLRVGGAIGVGLDCLDRAGGLLAAGCDALFIDAATGHTSRVVEVISQIRDRFGADTAVVAGNVVTPARGLRTSSVPALRHSKSGSDRAPSAPRGSSPVWAYHSSPPCGKLRNFATRTGSLPSPTAASVTPVTL